MREMCVVQPYEIDKRGGLHALPPVLARDASHGMQIARTLNCAGAIVFTRMCNPDLGEYGDAEIVLTVGRVPELQAAVA